MKILVSTIFFLVMSTVCLAQWIWQNPLPQGNVLKQVSYADATHCMAAGYTGTIIKSEDGGIHWSPLNSGTTMNLYSIDYVTQNSAFAAGETGTLIHTADGGNTWTSQNSGTLQNLNGIFFIDANNGWAVGDNEFILHTQNGGATWTIQHQSGFGHCLVGVFFLDAYNGTVVGGEGTILHTSNGGVTWVTQNSGTSFFLEDVSFTDANHGTIVGNETILYTSDGGTTWTPVVTGNYDWFSGVDFADGNTGIIVGGYGSILRSTDGGASWSTQSTSFNNGLFKVSFANPQKGLGVGNNGEIILTTDGGLSWTSQLSGTTLTMNAVCFPTESTGYVMGQAGTILKTTNSGVSWVALPSGTLNWITDAYFFDPMKGFAVGDNGTIMHTVNGGSGWTFQQSNTTMNLRGVSFTDPFTGTVVGAYGTILRTTDGGNSWNFQNSGTGNTLWDVEFLDGNTGTAVGMNGTILHTTNGGITWSPQNSGVTDFLYGIHLCDLNTWFAVGEMGTILRTVNSGVTWIKQVSGIENMGMLYSVDFSDANHGVTAGGAFGGYGAIIQTSNGGATWTNSRIGVLPQGACMRDPQHIWLTGTSGSILSNVFEANFSASDTLICSGASVQFTDQSAGSPTAWNWTFEGGSPATSTQQNPLVMYASPGEFDVTLIVTRGTETRTRVMTAYIQAETAVAAPSGSPIGPATVCQGQMQVTYSIDPLVNATSYVWSLPPGVSGSSDTNSITVDFSNSAISGNISVAGSNICGTGPVSSLFVTVNPLILVSVSISAYPQGQICSGTNVDFTANPVNGGTDPLYQWKLNGNDVGTNSATFSSSTLLNNDMIWCVMTSSASPCLSGSPASSNTINEIVNPIPVPGITRIGNYLQSTYGVSYQWYLEGNYINGANSQLYAPMQNGGYTVEIESVLGCTGMSDIYTVLWVGLDEPENQSHLQVYPNPAADILFVSVSDLAGIELISSGGQVLITTTADQPELLIDVSHYPKGIYLLRVFTSSGTFSRKVALK